MEQFHPNMHTIDGLPYVVQNLFDRFLKFWNIDSTNMSYKTSEISSRCVINIEKC